MHRHNNGPIIQKKLWGTWTVVLTIFAIHISSIPVIFFWLWHVLVLYCVFLFFHAIMYVFCACVEIYTSTSSYVYLPFTRPLHTHFWSFYWQHGMNFPFLSDFKCKYSSRRRRIRDTAVWCIFDPFKVCLLVQSCIHLALDPPLHPLKWGVCQLFFKKFLFYICEREANKTRFYKLPTARLRQSNQIWSIKIN